MSAVLQFGGGKDSLACLYMLRDQWPTLTVAYLNTGAAFPETLEQIDRIRSFVQVYEVRSNVLASIERHGWPSDVLPVRNTPGGKLTTSEGGIPMQTWWNCCNTNFWQPLHLATLQLKPTVIYRGQRVAEDYKSPLRDGDVIDGITYRFPIQGWSEARVEEYLHSQGVDIPEHYQHTQKSLDCWCCTAYLDAKLDQLHYLRERHPEKFAVIQPKLEQMRAAVTCAAQPLMMTETL